jgi:hypothetical protein
MSKQKKKLIATFGGKEAESLHNDESEITGTYRKSKGTYELYLTIDETV